MLIEYNHIYTISILYFILNINAKCTDIYTYK